MLTISREELRQRLDESKHVLLLDVLPEENFEDEHISGARNVPFDDDQEFVEKVSSLVSARDDYIVLYCAGGDCPASAKAARVLEKAGFTNVRAYEGGIIDWTQSSLPVEGEAAGMPETQIINRKKKQEITMPQTTLKDIMERHPEMISGDATLLEAAQKMKQLDCGVLPVGIADQAEGIITDRDIVVRAVANGDDPAIAIVRDYMTSELHTCREEDTLKDAAEAMKQNNVSRLVVCDADDRVTGILTFGHVLRSSEANDREVVDMVCSATGRKAA